MENIKSKLNDLIDELRIAEFFEQIDNLKTAGEMKYCYFQVSIIQQNQTLIKALSQTHKQTKLMQELHKQFWHYLKNFAKIRIFPNFALSI
jgi:hypothetical protein